MSTKCPSDEELLDHCLGRSRDDLLASIASHVETCRHCEERLRHLDQATDIQRNRSLESTVDLGLADTGDNHGSRAARLLPVGLPSIDNYEILEVLGQGGMGIVVKARQTRLNRDVAIKFPRHVADDIDRQRFLREARAAGGLRHPHICPVYEVGESDGRPFIVMALIEGETLRAWRDASHTTRESAEMVACLARGVQFAHEHGIIHRDLKPDTHDCIYLPAGR